MPSQNTSVIVGIIAGTVILILLAGFIFTFLMLFQKKQQKFKDEKQKLQLNFTQILLQSQLEIKEQTLRHLAFELHDNLGQIASLIKINLNTLQLDDKEKSIQKIDDTKELVRQLITDLKSLSVSLNGDLIAKIGFIKGIENEVERLNKTGEFATQLKVDGAVQLDENTTIILYRMVQEVINNIVKHSEARHIQFVISVSENLFNLVISDDGVGFNLEDKLTSGGSGLLNLQSRAKLIQAQFSIQSSPGVGTKICIELPLTPYVNPPNR